MIGARRPLRADPPRASVAVIVTGRPGQEFPLAGVELGRFQRERIRKKVIQISIPKLKLREVVLRKKKVDPRLA
jgi:hypothetical protein